METCLDPIWYLEDAFCKEMSHILGENCLGICKLQVKRKPNQHGDVHIAGFTRNVLSDKTADHCQQVANQIKSSPQLNKYINELDLSSNGQLDLCFNKVMVITSVIKNVIKSGDRYGLFMDNGNTSGPIKDYGDIKYVLNVNNSDGNSWLTGLDCLRVLVTTNYLYNLLSANQIPVSIGLSVIEDSIPHSTLDVLVLFNNHLIITNLGDYQETNMKIEKSLSDCQFVYQLSEPTDTSNSESLKSSYTSMKKCFDCQKFRQNTSLTPIPVTNSVIRRLSQLEMALRNCKEGYVIHMTNQRRLYSSKQHGLVWEALSSHSSPQMYLTLGDTAVHAKEQQQQQHIGVEELLRLRETHVRSAYLLKYGDIVKVDDAIHLAVLKSGNFTAKSFRHTRATVAIDCGYDPEIVMKTGQGWNDSITSFAVATLKLQILSVPQNNQVRFDTSKEAQDFRPFTFILYNCARLSKLFHHYEEAVLQGLYPPLPDIEKIDFSLLREKDEWNLVLRYITVYPSIVRTLLNDLLASSTHESVLRVNVNKICSFLMDLSQDFSSYYGRTHVLGEARPHLFPTMFARLYLLKAIQQVFRNCLNLLNVQPLSQM